MSLLWTLKRDVMALTHCKLKGHVIQKKVLNDLKEGDRQETRCERCHYPVWVYMDPDDNRYYRVSEDE